MCVDDTDHESLVVDEWNSRSFSTDRVNWAEREHFVLQQKPMEEGWHYLVFGQSEKSRAREKTWKLFASWRTISFTLWLWNMFTFRKRKMKTIRSKKSFWLVLCRRNFLIDLLHKLVASCQFYMQGRISGFSRRGRYSKKFRKFCRPFFRSTKLICRALTKH